MPDEKQDDPLTRLTKALQTNVQGAGPAASASYALIGAIVLLGGLGYAFDAWRGTAPIGLLVGLGVGVVTGFYELVRATWRR